MPSFILLRKLMHLVYHTASSNQLQNKLASAIITNKKGRRSMVGRESPKPAMIVRFYPPLQTQNLEHLPPDFCFSGR